MEKMANLYGQLFDGVKQFFTDCEGKKITTLVPMKGCRYGSEDIKLMVVGRATNGWGEMDSDYTNQKKKYVVDALELLEKDDRVSDKGKRFEWIKREKHKPKKERYVAEAKPFWNYTRSILKELSKTKCSEEDWYQSLLWSNLFPVSFAKEGNPSEDLKAAQLPVAKDLLREQLFYFQPKHVLIISNWEGWFYINKGKEDCPEDECTFLQEVKRNDKNNEVVKGRGIVGNSLVVVSRRPEYFKKDVFVKDVIAEFELLKEEARKNQ